jgi:hypothetical protein
MVKTEYDFMETELSDLVVKWRQAERAVDLFGILVKWRRFRPQSAKAINRLTRLIYVEWVRNIKLAEFSIYHNILNDSEREICDRLSRWSAEDELHLPDNLPVRNWTMKGVERLRQGYIDESDIRTLAIYPTCDWEVICRKLGFDFDRIRPVLDQQCLSICRSYISSPTIIDAIKVKN